MVSQPNARSTPLKIARSARPRLRWGADTAEMRGPIVATVTQPAHRNVMGTHGGSYSVYQGLAAASGALSPQHRPDLSGTQPLIMLSANAAWRTIDRIVSLDPWGAQVTTDFATLLAQGYDLRPSIALTQAHLHLPEVQRALTEGQLKPDGVILKTTGEVAVTKIAIDPVWYLPGIAKRLGVDDLTLRRALHQQTGGMVPELLSRPDLKVWLPPIGNTTVYVLGDVTQIANPNTLITLRIHDECNGSDVFGSDICTCRPYLIHGIEEGIKTAQTGGVGVVVYNRKEGRALGEVTKFLVYNARKHHGDRAENYFERTECVAGVQDARCQLLMPDVLHWLGIQRIDRLVSMSHLKYDAIVASGITVVDRIALPESLIPAQAQIEIMAKKAAGYYTEEG